MNNSTLISSDFSYTFLSNVSKTKESKYNNYDINFEFQFIFLCVHTFFIALFKCDMCGVCVCV